MYEPTGREELVFVRKNTTALPPNWQETSSDTVGTGTAFLILLGIQVATRSPSTKTRLQIRRKEFCHQHHRDVFPANSLTTFVSSLQHQK